MEEIYHKYKIYNGQNTLMLYVNYPDEYEFSLDFDSLKKNVKSVASKIREYAFKNLGTVKNETALLILNGVVVGTILLTNLKANLNTEKITNLTNNTQIESVTTSNKETTSTPVLNTYTKDLPVEENTANNITTANKVANTSNKTTTSSNTSLKPQANQNTTTTNKVPTNQNSNTNTTPQTNKPANNTNTNTNPNTSTNTNQNTTTSNEKMVSLKLKNGSIISISLEEYVIGVVGSEMPASFSTEALKAQAVAARTYALKRIASGKTLTATTSDQVYKTNDELKAMWGNSFNTYYNKVKNAVNATKGKYMTYNGNYIDALYFSTSNGKTEDPSYVWGTSYPYIKPVDSSVDKNVKSFSYTKTMNLSDFCSKLGVSISNNSDINILSRTPGDRVNQVFIGGKTFTGVNVRTLLGLRSADFTISISGSTVTISTKGFGHGCGMSQYGANELAKKGYTYTQILHHYYTGIQIK